MLHVNIWSIVSQEITRKIHVHSMHLLKWMHLYTKTHHVGNSGNMWVWGGCVHLEIIMSDGA